VVSVTPRPLYPRGGVLHACCIGGWAAPDGLLGHEGGGGPEAVTPVIVVVCDLIPCSLVFRYPCFEGTRSLCLQGSSIFKPEDAFRTSGRLIIHRVRKRLYPFFIFFSRCPVCGKWCKLH